MKSLLRKVIIFALMTAVILFFYPEVAMCDNELFVYVLKEACVWLYKEHTEAFSLFLNLGYIYFYN
ncbi:hypothetical protein Y919_01040 [Caloranaerobacter azorensis H53214]|uniref:Uncharacterized protein n=1 Tax=Caloranaerobacter azorensis H53214 TaxID=1156417 RepID=A0A096BKJ2_9FIRM|nr:hypothetical protein [Caloranaerobacter azorensis]KGG81367.1 hypothetical protein Y919_01040 [Caloranaerobacter azorensis H53214]